MSYSLSSQQQKIVSCKDPVMVVHAVAGSGKTTTAVAYARANLDKKILAVQFGAANAREAKQRYPRENTLASTMHALAINVLSEAQRRRLAKQWSVVALRNDLAKIGVRADYRVSAAVYHTLNSFFQSQSGDLSREHTKRAGAQIEANESLQNNALIYARRLWRAMQTDESIRELAGQENDIGIPHDAYLKMFSLSNLRTTLSQFDTVILDEAQDANPVMIEVIERMREAGKQIILLGDEHQSIYSFRGAVNAMQVYDDQATHLPLTQSWRFGQSTADLANEILALKGGRYFVEGLGEDRVYDSTEPTTYLSRTNARLVEFAAMNVHEPINWVGGVQNYNIEKLLNMYNLKIQRPDLIADARFRQMYKTYERAVQASEYDAETKRMIKLIEEHGSRVPELVKLIMAQAKIAESKGNVNTTITTAHKSKGLEFGQVKLLDDFRNSLKEAEMWCQGAIDFFPEEEINLIYMAVTRAKFNIDPDPLLDNWIYDLPKNRGLRKRFITGGHGNSAKKNIKTSSGNITKNIPSPLMGAPVREF